MPIYYNALILCLAREGTTGRPKSAQFCVSLLIPTQSVNHTAACLNSDNTADNNGS